MRAGLPRAVPLFLVPIAIGAAWSPAGCAPAPAVESAPAGPARFTLRGRWDGPEVTVRFDPRDAPVEAVTVRRALARACRAWSELSPLDVRLIEGAAADVTVSFERGSHGPCTSFGRDTTVAHTGPVEPGTFLHLDGDRDWSPGGSPLERTLLHEIGHVLGLGHSPDEGALMHADARVDALTHADRCALWSLYGGGEPFPGDLVIEGATGTSCVLRDVATPGRTDFCMFDVDGDGDDELLVWRTDTEGAGELQTFYFRPTLELIGSIGPKFGMAAPDATVTFVETEGERRMIVTHGNGNRTVRVFDDRGDLHPVLEDAGLPGERARSGDLDGDGRPETVRRRGS